MTIRDRLSEALGSALAELGVEPPEEIHLERPARREHGDFSSNVALTSAKQAGRNPRDLAAEIVERINAAPPEHVLSAEVAGPGFVNFRLDDSWLHALVGRAVAVRHRLRALRRRRGSQGDGRVRVGQPDRTGSRRTRSRGGLRRQPGPAPDVHRPRGRAGVLPERPWRADAAVRRVPGGPQGRPGTARGRLQGRVHHRVGRGDAGGRRSARVGRGPCHRRPGAGARND